MNAIYLHKPDGTPTKWSQCGECGCVATPGNFDVSQKCCTCYDCGLPLGKDEKVPYADGAGNRSLYHRECERARRAKREAEQLESAELVAGYDGPVYFEGGHGSYGDSYFADVAELAEWMDDQEFLADGEDRPKFAFCCTEHPFPAISADRLIESYLDDMDEDAGDRLDGQDDLEKACAVFTEANKGVTSWYLDHKRKVAIPAKAEDRTNG